MNSDGFLWIPIDAFGFLLGSYRNDMDFYRTCSSAIPHNSRITPAQFPHDVPSPRVPSWILMDSYGLLWIPMDSYGFLWIPLDSYWIPMEMGWISMELVALQCRITPA